VVSNDVTVHSIVTDYLRVHGYDGLYSSGECGCLLDTGLAPCGEMGESCMPGVKQSCTCGEECDYHVGARKEECGE
jgi:hypothetical protein